MKVRVTFEVSEEQRLAVGLLTHGNIKLMSHEEMSHYITVLVATQLKTVTDAYDQVVAELVEKLKT